MQLFMGDGMEYESWVRDAYLLASLDVSEVNKHVIHFVADGVNSFHEFTS